MSTRGVKTRADNYSFVLFFQEQWPRLVAGLSWSLPPGVDAEDIAQEAFAIAFSRWSLVSHHPRPDVWLFLTALRVANRARLRHLLRLRKERAAGWEGNFSANSEVELAVQQALLALPIRQRKAIVLRLYYGMSTRETARELGCREGTVKSLVSRGRAVLRENLSNLEEEDVHDHHRN